jgi:organic hydroperoxide reductase OsmC/OhrA
VPERQEKATMSTYTATIRWDRGEAAFIDNRYSRAHAWIFDGGITVPASSSPHVVPRPYSDVNAVDPEEAFVAAVASCHMLWFLSIAAQRGYRVDRYADAAEGTMAKDANGRLAITRVVLRPDVAFSGERCPGADDIARLHDDAHAACFIASSVRSEIVCEPRAR